MELRLKYEPVLASASLFAADIVESAWQVNGVTLDYSPASLAAVDQIIESFRLDGTTPDQVGETLFGFGCYVGEVFVRHAGGTWRLTHETPMDNLAASPFVIDLGHGKYCNPVGKLFKRLENGQEDNLPYFYQVFTRPASPAEGVVETALPEPPAQSARRWWRRC